MKKLVIFDLDGTLLNTIADLAEATNYALQKLNYPPTLKRSSVRLWETASTNCLSVPSPKANGQWKT